MTLPILAALLALPAGGAPALDAELDAAFVSMTVPEKVAASEVFPVAITMRNTGAEPWEGWPIRLRSISPKGGATKGGATWGTDYILIAQGTTVSPGDEYTFRSALRAPVEPGTWDFRWQVSKDGTRWFGESTPPRRIVVEPRPEPAGGASPPRGRPPGGSAPGDRTPGGRTPGGRKVLALADFEYVGSFKAPRAVGGARGAFSESGLALRTFPDGRHRLLMNYTHPSQVLFEVAIPRLVRAEAGGHAELETADVEKVWGPVTIARPGEDDLHPNGGFAWIEEKETLIWTWYHGYKTGEAPPILGAARLGRAGELTVLGPWRVSAPDGLYKSYWGGVVALPAAFAEKYTPGRPLALGFGGYYSICGPASRGPALGAIPEPTEGGSILAVTAILHHPHDRPAPRDGDYLNANCGFWGEQPAGPDRGTWTYDDRCRAGVFVEAEAGHAYVAFVRLGTGRLGYDFGTITSAGASEWWYVYDPEELGEAALAKREPWQLEPVSRSRVAYPIGRTVTGACFDPRADKLYLCVTWAYPDGLESHPAVHVYAVR